MFADEQDHHQNRRGGHRDDPGQHAYRRFGGAPMSQNIAVAEAEGSAAPESAPTAGHPRRWWILGALSLSLMVIGLDLTVLSVALPVLVADLKATTTELQWIMDSYILVLAALLLPAGSLGDRIGRKRVLVAGLGLFLAGSLLCAYAWSAGSLIGFRAFMGLGGAIVMPLTLSVLPAIFSEQERPKAIAAWSVASGVSVALGPIVGGWLLGHYFWGSIFLFNVRLFANPRFTWAVVGFGLVGLVLTGAMFLFTQYLQDVEGYRPFGSGLRMIPLVVGMLVGAQAVSRLLPRIGTKVAMAAGFTLLAGGLALFGTATVDTGYGFVAACLTLMGAGLGMAMTPGLDAIMGAMPEGEFGAGSAVASTFRQVGAAIGVALLGDIYLNRYVASLHLPAALPAPVAHIARQSVGAANAVASKLPAPLAGQVRGEAHAAFMSGLDWTLLLAAGVAVVAVGLVAAFLPGRKPAAQAPKSPMPEAGRGRPRPGPA